MDDLTRDILLTGAAIAGEGAKDDLSVDEVAAALLNAKQEKQRKIAERSGNFRARRAERAGNKQVAEDFLAEDNQRNQNILGIKTVPNTVIEFGEQGTQDALQNFGGSTRSGQTADYGQAQAEIEKASERKDPNELIRKYRVKGDPYGFEEEKIYIEDGMKVPERFVRAAKERDLGFPYINRDGGWSKADREQPASVRSGIDALSRLQAKIESGTLTGPELAQAEEVQRRLQLDVNPQARAQSDRQTGLNTVDNDRAIYQSERIKNILQTLELGPLSLVDPARQTVGVVQPGQRETLPYFTNNNLRSIGHIGSIGHAKRGTEFNVGQEITRRNATRMVQHLPAPGFSGPEGPTIGYADSRGLPIPVTEDIVPSNQVNKVRSWIMNSVEPQLAEEKFKQVDIGKALASLSQGLSKLKVEGRPVDSQLSKIRSVEDLSDFLNYYVQAKINANESFSYKTGNKETVIDNPSVSDLLSIGNTREYAQNDLSRALYQSELGRLSSVNSSQNDAYMAGQGISIGAKDSRNLEAYPASVYAPGSPANGRRVNGTYFATNQTQPIGVESRVMLNTPGNGIELTDLGVQIATLGQNNQRAVNYELERQAQLDPKTAKKRNTRRDVASLFKNLSGDKRSDTERLSASELNDAQSSSMGAVSGERVPKTYFLSQSDSKLSPEERLQVKGPNAKFANEIELRSQTSDAQREAQKVLNDRGRITLGPEATTEDPSLSLLRERDRRMAADDRSQQSAPRRSKPPEVSASGQILFGGQVVPRMKVYDDPKFANSQAVQGLRATSAANSSTPDPVPLLARGTWVGSDTQGQAGAPIDGLTINAAQAQSKAPNQAPLAGISFNERAPDPWMQPVGTGNGITKEIAKRSNTDRQKTLPYGVSTSGPAQAPVQSSARKQFTDKTKNFLKSPKYKDVRKYGQASIVGGSIAGLAAMITGERDKREQEQYS